MVKKRVTAREKVRSKKVSEANIKDGKSDVALMGKKSEGAGEQLEFLLDAVGNSGREKRHLVKQMKFLKKLQATQEALAAKKQIGKKKKKRRGLDGHSSLRDLSSLGEFLPTFGDLSGDSGSRKAKVMRSAALQQITETETKQLAAVLHHPSFKQDPFAAIHQHLQNTLPPPPTADTKPSKKSSKKKGTKKKHGGGNLGMDTN